MDLYYQNKTVYITGGSSGIGLGLAQQLVSSGAHVLLIARNEDKLAAAVALVKQSVLNNSQRIDSLSLDVTTDAVAATLAQAVTDFGAPDVLITSAGVAVAKSFMDHTIDDFQHNMDANVMGTIRVVHALVPAMKANGGGHIALISSLGGLMPVWGYAAYSSSKAAVKGLADVLRMELKEYGFAISQVAPPEVYTPMIAAEAATVPWQTRLLKDFVGTTDVDSIATHTLANIKKKKPLIVRGVRAKLFLFTYQTMPWMFRLSTSLILKLFAK